MKRLLLTISIAEIILLAAHEKMLCGENGSDTKTATTSRDSSASSDPSHPPVGVQPKRPKDFVPFKYPHSPEDLMKTDTPKLEAFAAKSWKEMEASFAKGPFKPEWASLAKHSCPEWFKDAKLGLFIDWGPWSVAGYAPVGGAGAVYPDWYEQHLYGEFKVYHEKTWGKDVTADDLMNLMRADAFDTDKFVDLAKAGGMKYVVPFLKHHGGYCLWDSSVTHRNSMEIGLKRDFATELATACQAKGMKYGIYVSVGEYAYPVIVDGKLRKVGFNGTNASNLGPNEPFIAGKIPVKNYARDYFVPQVKELIEKTNPDLIWYDGEWEATPDARLTAHINAYYYNHAAGRGQEVATNDRLGANSRCDKIPGIRPDFLTSEHNEITTATARPWEECRGIGHSFGYNWQEALDDKHVMSERDLVVMFVDIVARGGNLLLMVNPDGSGHIPPNQERRIRALGDWLKVNGEGIYATRSMPLAQEGNVSYTRSKDSKFVYAICKKWPGKSLTLKGIHAAKDAKITMLGVAEPLEWQQNEQGLTVTIPENLQNEKSRPCQHAWVFKIPM
jgi:alpha-L-fucosidase